MLNGGATVSTEAPDAEPDPGNAPRRAGGGHLFGRGRQLLLRVPVTDGRIAQQILQAG